MKHIKEKRKENAEKKAKIELYSNVPRTCQFASTTSNLNLCVKHFFHYGCSAAGLETHRLQRCGYSENVMN